MFEGIKNKLGFGDAADDYGERGYDARYEEGAEEFDDYDDGLGDAADGSAASGRYEPYSTVTTRPVNTSYSASRAARGSGASSPRLVSMDDVRAHTQVPESLQRDPLPARRVSSPHRGNRMTVDANEPIDSAPAAAAAPATDSPRERSESLNNLFSSTAPAASASSASFDPYEAYAGAGAAKHDPTRSLTVLKPASYAEVERVAKALKAGDVVVLALGNTPDSLSKRILDFSFGVASALDASVDCVADKVFVVARGAALTDAERASLRTKGVL